MNRSELVNRLARRIGRGVKQGWGAEGLQEEIVEIFDDLGRITTRLRHLQASARNINTAVATQLYRATKQIANARGYLNAAEEDLE